MLNENELISALCAGDENAFLKLYEYCSAKIYNTALSYSKNIEDAEEITQDVFLKIYKQINSFKRNSSLDTWIYRITINTSLNYIHKNQRTKSIKKNLETSKLIDFEHPGVLLENKENAKALFKAMEQLNDNQKTAFILSFIEHLPRQQVADIMGLSLKAIEALLQRAKKNMRSHLEKIYPHRRK